MKIFTMPLAHSGQALREGLHEAQRSYRRCFINPLNGGYRLMAVNPNMVSRARDFVPDSGIRRCSTCSVFVYSAPIDDR